MAMVGLYTKYTTSCRGPCTDSPPGLPGCPAADDALLYYLPCVPRLTHLDLRSCHLSDWGLGLLARAAPRLAHLDLTGCSLVTDVGVAWLAGNRMLTHLSLAFCDRSVNCV